MVYNIPNSKYYIILYLGPINFHKFSATSGSLKVNGPLSVQTGPMQQAYYDKN